MSSRKTAKKSRKSVRQAGPGAGGRYERDPRTGDLKRIEAPADIAETGVNETEAAPAADDNGKS